MSDRVPIKPIELVKFGKTLLASELESALIYIATCFEDHGYVNSGAGASAHILQKYLDLIQVAFRRITDPVLYVIDSGDYIAKADLALRNIARLARMDLTGDALVHLLNNVKEELCTTPDGLLYADFDDTTDTDIFTDVAFLVAGGNFKGFIGTWDNQKYQVQDEIIGGIFIVLFYILQFWNMHVASINDLLHSIGEFSKEGGSIRGNYKPLIPSDQKTWGSALVLQENAHGASVFGMSTAYLDDPTLRSITVCKLEGFEKLMNKLLTPSQFTWRFSRFLRIKPVYFMWNPESSTDGAVYSDWATDVMLFVNTENKNQWRTFNNQINEFVTDLKSFYFRNKAYANLKTKLTFVPFGEFPVPQPTGNGGILLHQMTYWEDGGVPSTDKLFCKLQKDTDLTGHMVLRTRRTFNEDKRFLMIGDITVEDYQLMTALFVSDVDDQAGSKKTLGRNKLPFQIKSWFAFGLGKTEEEPYKIGRTIYDGVSPANTASGLHNKMPAPIGDNSSNHEKWTLYTNSDDLLFPISLSRGIGLFKYGRGWDPYKKLLHQLADINELDIDNVMKVVRSYIIPENSVSTIEASPIPVSATVEPSTKVEIPEIGKEQTKVSDDVNSVSETKVGSAIPVSAAPDKKDSKKDEKKEEKK